MPRNTKSRWGLLVVLLVLLLSAVAGGVFFLLNRPLQYAAQSPPVRAENTAEVEPLSSVPVYTNVDVRAWRKDHPQPWGGWGYGSSAKDYRNNFMYMGPLGIRVLAHTRERQRDKTFREIAPQCLKDSSRFLALNALEVQHIDHGSPADGILQEGDLILEIDGQTLLSGREYRPEWKFSKKDSRNLQLMAGEAIDRDEAVGKMDLLVLRAANPNALPGPENIRRTLTQPSCLEDKLRRVDFDVSVTNLQQLILVLDQGKNNAGDNFVWINPRFVMDDGSEQPLDRQDFLRGSCGWGRIHFEPNNQEKRSIPAELLEHPGIFTHAPSEIAYLVPSEARRFKVTAYRWLYGDIRPRVDGIKPVNPAKDLPPATRRRLVNITIPLARIGSFAEGYPANCPKSDWIVKQNVSWLLAQQRENGSWPRWGGYTGDHFDTGIVGLALLATGDESLMPAIRKAAYYEAYEAVYDGWATPRATALLFLAEYYLRTKDEGILDGLDLAYQRVVNSVFYEGFVGHGERQCGYGYGGVAISVGHTCAALAVAEACPIEHRPGAFKTVLKDVASIAVDGALPYGRCNAHVPTGAWPKGRRGGYARTGPAVVGSLVGGGSQKFINEARRMYRQTIELADMAHASQTLGWWGTDYALPALDPELFHAFMRQFRYKIAMNRCWDGGFAASDFPYDFQGAEGVMGGLFRTAVYVLTLCADRHQLVINGNKKYWAANRRIKDPVNNYDYYVYRYYMRNWAVADTILGKHPHPQLKQAVQELYKMPADKKLFTNTFNFVEQRLPAVLKEITTVPGVRSRTRAYAAELVSGLDLQLDAAADENAPQKQTVSLTIYWPLHGSLHYASKEEQKAYSRKQPYPVKGTVTIKNAEGIMPEDIRFEFDSRKTRTDWERGKAVLRKKVTLTKENPGKFKLPVMVEYTMAGRKYAYRGILRFNYSQAEVGRSMASGERRITIPGRIVRDCHGQEVMLQLPNGIILGLMTPERRNIPLLLPGSRKFIPTLDYGRPQEGDIVKVEYVSHSINVGVVMRMALIKSYVKNIRPVAMQSIPHGLVKKDKMDLLFDGDIKTGVQLNIRPCKDQTAEIVFDLGEQQAVNAFGLWNEGRGLRRVQILAMVDGKYRLLFSGPADSSVRFPTLRTRYIKVRLTGGRVRLNEVKIMYNPKRGTVKGKWEWRR